MDDPADPGTFRGRLHFQALTAQKELIARTPGQAFSIVYAVTNDDAQSRDLEFEGLGAQSLTLNVNPDSTTLAAGASASVTFSGTLPASIPADVGDLILSRTHVVVDLGRTLLARPSWRTRRADYRPRG